MGYYLTQRAEIKAQLDAVSGIGKVYQTRKNPTSIEEYKEKYSIDGVINVCWFSRISGTERESQGVGSVDETSEIQYVQKDDIWEIELRYAYNDNETNPSETIFNNLVDAIEEKFRFLPGLNDKCFRSFPLQRTRSGIFEFLGGLVLCHSAVWQLILQERVESTEIE
jgi:hypothetical protein